MRHIGTLAEEQLAERFTAFLVTKGIATHVDRVDDHWEIWVKDEDQVEAASSELAQFRQNPTSPQYDGVVTRAQNILRDEFQRRRAVQRNVREVKSRWGPIQGRAGSFTWTLIIVSAAVALVTNFGGARTQVVFQALAFSAFSTDPGQVRAEDTDGRAALNPDALGVRLTNIARGEVWRLITPIFIHFGIIHLLFNCFMLYQFARLIEVRFGTSQLAVLVLLCAVIPNFLQGVMPQAWDGTPPVEIAANLWITPFGGLSGVVFGLFGFAWIRSVVDPNCGYRIPPFTLLLLVGWMLLGITHLSVELFNLRMANWGHGGGLAIGALAAYLPSVFKRR